MSTSLANAVKRKTHKERSQPNARRKYGLLEKHKDYVLRAKDFHRKENTIKFLRKKADDKNPDEFYFAMQNTTTKKGVHTISRTVANKYSQDELKLMKTQDIKYLALKARTEAEKVKKLQSSLHYIGLATQSKHTVFVDDEKEARAFDPAEYFDTPKELLERSFNRPRHEQLQAADTRPLAGDARKVDRARGVAYRELAQRAERQGKLERMTEHMEYRKTLTGKGAKRKLAQSELVDELADDAAPVHKWTRERKR